MGEITESSSTPEICGSEVEGWGAKTTKERIKEEGKGHSAELLWLQRVAFEEEIGQIVVEDDGEHTCISYWRFDTEKLSYKFFSQSRMRFEAEEKLNLLRAIGRCMTLRKIVAIGLTGKELTALLTHLKSIPVLECIAIESLTAPEQENAANGLLEHDDTKSDEEQLSPTWADWVDWNEWTDPKNWEDTTDDGGKVASIEYVETICQSLGEILRTSRTIRSLKLYLWGLTIAGADHLASGLRDNEESDLRRLFLFVSELVEPNVVMHVAAIVRSAPKLSELWLREVGVLDDEDIEALGLALARSQLTSLGLHSVVKGASDLLGKALTGAQSSRCITTLELKGVMSGIGDFLPKILSSNQTLKELLWDQREEGLRPDEWRSIGEALNSNVYVELFRILVPWSTFRGKAMDGLDALLRGLDTKKPCVQLYLNSGLLHGNQSCPWVSSYEWMRKEGEEIEWMKKEGEEIVNVKKPVIEINLDCEGASDSNTIWTDLVQALNSKDIRFSSLHLQMSPRLRGPRGREAGNFLEALRDSSCLRLLTIAGGNGYNWPGGWKSMIDCLRFNTSITHLRLADCDDLDEDVFRRFMELLHVNLTLEKVRLDGTSWETDGKKALIDEALRRNATRDADLSVFRAEKIPFHSSRNCRLFLCGPSHAGKTRLRQTIARSSGGSTLSGFTTPWGTKGSEVELLKNDHEMQITIWELAGQEILRSLQSVLFPRADHISLFLFVFSPYDKDRCCMKQNLLYSLKKELENWLRFIASNSVITGRTLPRVLVVFSHKDKLTDRDVRGLRGERVSDIVTELRKEFQTVVDILKTPSKLYQVDASERKEVKPLTQFISEIFRRLVDNEGSVAPRVCSQVSYELAKRTEYIKSRPVRSVAARLVSRVSSESAKWMKYIEPRPVWSVTSTVFSQVSSVLAKRKTNIKSRPVWSSREFSGFCAHAHRLLHSGSNCDSVGSDSLASSVVSYLDYTGSVIVIPSLERVIVDPNWLTNIFLVQLIQNGHRLQLDSEVRFIDLERLLSRSPGDVSGVDNLFLQELLIHLDLCYPVPDQYTYYIPALVKFNGLDKGFRPSWSSNSPQESSQEFIGFRVECDNPRRMSMTAIFYSRFQIYIWRKLKKETNLKDRDVICCPNYMHLHMGSREIILEAGDLDGSFIDVMVKCSENETREVAAEAIKRLIIEELRTFCASSCPGIALVVGMLRTECVEKLVPLASRKGQAILIRQVKENFKAHIMDKVKDMKLESSGQTRLSSSLLDYEHFWPSVPPYLPESFELATKFLLVSDVRRVMKEVLEEHELQLSMLNQTCEEMNYEMDEASCASEVVTEMGTSGLAWDIGDSFSSSTKKNIFFPGLVLSHKIKRSIGDYAVWEGSESDTDPDEILTLQHQLQSSQSLFMSNVDKRIGYTAYIESGEWRSRTPKRPCLILEDVSIFTGDFAAMPLGTRLRLHLMCESIAGSHFITGHPGFSLCVDEQNKEWLRRIHEVSLKVIYYYAKAGLHGCLGLGPTVPGFKIPQETLSSTIVENIKTERSGDVTLDQAWNCLDVLVHKSVITDSFKLSRVKYLHLGERGYAWVCEACQRRGIRNESL